MTSIGRTWMAAALLASLSSAARAQAPLEEQYQRANDMVRESAACRESIEAAISAVKKLGYQLLPEGICKDEGPCVPKYQYTVSRPTGSFRVVIDEPVIVSTYPSCTILGEIRFVTPVSIEALTGYRTPEYLAAKAKEFKEQLDRTK